jgi:hypothetical protein
MEGEMSDDEIEQRIAAKCAEIRKEVEDRFGPNPPLVAHVEVLTVLVASLLVQSDIADERAKERLDKLRGLRAKIADGWKP